VDLVHGQGTERDSAMAAVCSGRPSLVTIHGHMGRIAELLGAKFGSYYWMISRLERWILGRADGVICLNTYTVDRVRGRAKRTWVIPNAAEIEYFDAARHHRRGGKRGICVANVAPWKNQVALIDACAGLLKSGDLELCFAGSLPPSGDYADEFRARLAAVAGLRHLGFLNREQIQREAAESAFLVLPSIEENCPMALIESMASGVPVVASRVGGVPNLVDDGVTGLLFDPTSPEDIRRQVGRMVADEALRARLSAKAQDVARTRFHPNAVAKAHLNAYRDLLGRSPQQT
jgi:glycosyltransferase involved in cell wall biosynthesis